MLVNGVVISKKNIKVCTRFHGKSFKVLLLFETQINVMKNVFKKQTLSIKGHESIGVITS